MDWSENAVNNHTFFCPSRFIVILEKDRDIDP